MCWCGEEDDICIEASGEEEPMKRQKSLIPGPASLSKSELPNCFLFYLLTEWYNVPELSMAAFPEMAEEWETKADVAFLHKAKGSKAGVSWEGGGTGL